MVPALIVMWASCGRTHCQTVTSTGIQRQIFCTLTCSLAVLGDTVKVIIEQKTTLITQRSQVQILPPLPRSEADSNRESASCMSCANGREVKPAAQLHHRPYPSDRKSMASPYCEIMVAHVVGQPRDVAQHIYMSAWLTKRSGLAARSR